LRSAHLYHHYAIITNIS